MADEDGSGASIELTLIGGFALRCGDKPVRLPSSAQRLLTFLALHDRPLARLYVAGTLWPETAEGRAFANLRSALWRLQKPGYELLVSTARDLRIAPGVHVDYHAAEALARSVLRARDGAQLDLTWEPLAGDLLPDWYDDWVVPLRERHRQCGLHALEALSERLAHAGRYGAALDVALAAVAGEPLRESAQRVVIKTHLAEGNASEAIRQYHHYRTLLREQLAIDPSPEMESLLADLPVRGHG